MLNLGWHINILSPRTGWPARHMAAVTVLASLGQEYLCVDVTGRVGGSPHLLPEVPGVTR